MRLVSVNTLKNGAKIKMPIKRANGQILLHTGTILTDRYISYLKNAGFRAVYIDDEIISTEIESLIAITDETKIRALEIIKSSIQSIKTGKALNVNAVKEVGKKIYDDVRAVAHKPINLFNMFVIDESKYLHSVNVAVMVSALALVDDLQYSTAQDIITGAFLHDVLVENMQNEDKKHPLETMEHLKKNPDISAISYMSIAMHHENYDGTGFPKNIAGDKIYIGARYIKVCDTYDNLIYGLSGHKKMKEYQALEYINAHSGTLFDPKIVGLFNKAIAIYPTGATVALNNGCDAIVTRQNVGIPSRPVVRLLMKEWENCLEYDLLSSNTTFINEVKL